MNKLIQNSLLFLILISIVCFNLKTTILQFEYSFFNESFTEQFCQNKAKPELKCNGKCHLKKISKEQDNQDSSKKSFADNEVLFLCPLTAYASTYLIPSQKKKIYSKKDLFQVHINYPPEHPPQNLV
ncbi:hypothetical protein HNP99_003477 [Flavobacterium sp. 28A]|uniref:hypothetical protein n=1 Tax=Flavobacterium sp. 28A TaxID=2735895 RepID=UPI00156F07C5|nr:hypothetical protein [Flavobacterium sp. 28A]NRT17102.1 hypothetical protein [Flavobacterium sp. 28A]